MEKVQRHTPTSASSRRALHMKSAFRVAGSVEKLSRSRSELRASDFEATPYRTCYRSSARCADAASSIPCKCALRGSNVQSRTLSSRRQCPTRQRAVPVVDSGNRKRGFRRSGTDTVRLEGDEVWNCLLRRCSIGLGDRVRMFELIWQMLR